MSNLPKVTFGIVNCNRLHYLKSCLESLLYCTESYDNKQIIIVDNASSEKGTQEYLDEKEEQGIKTIRQKNRDPSNEFAKGLNLIVENSDGQYVCLLQGDMQFVVKGEWLERYIEYFEKHKSNIGCIALDAQRKVRISNHAPFGIFNDDDLESDFRFFIDPKRPPIAGAGEVIYSRDIIQKIYPWKVDNLNHEGGDDSETAMLKKVKDLIESSSLKDIFFISPQIPVSAAINTDPRGTNARVRGNRRYGDYWPPKEDFRYYKIFDLDDIISKLSKDDLPISIEDSAKGVGWKVPKDQFGNWLKNPIRPETATTSDYVLLEGESEIDHYIESHEYIDEWLDD